MFGMASLSDRNITNLSVQIDTTTKQGTVYLQQGNLEQAKESFEYAFKISKGFNDDYTARACAFNVGAIYVALHQASTGLDYLQQAIPPQNQRDGKSNGDLYYNFGLGYESLKQDSEAVKYYELAYEEYQFERDNVHMEAEIASRAGALYGRLQSPLQAARSYGIAAKTYAQLQDFSQQALCLCQQALQLVNSLRYEEAVHVANDCMVLCHRVQSQEVLGKLYNELGLIFTQCHDFSKASTCFEFALPIIRTSPQDKRCEAIILQNIGAVYNSLGDYQRALAFHEQAAAVYADIGSRGCQGQCFINLAFAYSQLGDTETAGECYLHAVQAAKDGSDKRGQWQAMEGLGAVYFNQGNIDKAVAYFQLTLKMLADSADGNQVAHERIVSKLTDALQCQASFKQHPVESITRTSRPSTAQSVQAVTSYRPDIYVRPPTRDEQRQMQQIRPGSAKPKSSRDHPDNLQRLPDHVIPEAIKEEENSPSLTLISTGRRVGKRETTIQGIDPTDLNLHRRNKKGLLRTGKHDSEMAWNKDVRESVFSDDSIIRKCLPGHSDDEAYQYKERLRPPSTDEEKDTHSEGETSTLSLRERQRNQNRVKDILRGGKHSEVLRDHGDESTDSEGNVPHRVGLSTSKLPPAGLNNGINVEKVQSGDGMSSSAEGNADDDDNETLIETSVIDSKADSNEDSEENHDQLRQYQQRLRRQSVRDGDGSDSNEVDSNEVDSEEESPHDSDTVNTEDFNRKRISPAVPKLSPPPTTKMSGTYENPIPYKPSGSSDEGSGNSEDSSQEHSQKGDKKQAKRNFQTGNYFRSQNSEQKHVQDQTGLEKKETITDPDDPIYQTIRSIKRDGEHQVHATIEPLPHATTSQPSSILHNKAPELPPRQSQPVSFELSRAEEEEMLKKKHHEYMNRNAGTSAYGSDDIVPLPVKTERKDRSRKAKSQMCVMM